VPRKAGDAKQQGHGVPREQKWTGENRKTPRPARAKWHCRATCAAVARSYRATTVLLRDGFKTRDFMLVWGS